MTEFLIFLFSYGTICAVGGATVAYYAVNRPPIEPQYRAPRAELPVARLAKGGVFPALDRKHSEYWR